MTPIGLLLLLHATSADLSGFRPVPAGSFVMGDHSGLGGGDTNHPSDEVPLHVVSLTAFAMETFHVTNARYARFLTAWLASGQVQLKGGIAVLTSTGDTLTETREAVAYSRISCSGTTCTVLDGREDHPVTNIRWKGAAAFCNWMSQDLGLTPCYDLSTWSCDFAKDGIRLPTEAEWEYAALGGRKDPYPIFPWGDDTSATGKLANWENSGDPWEVGDFPRTTPVGFFDGTTRLKASYGWPDSVTSFATRDATNGYGLQDMSGNAWQWVNDWYANPYYQVSPGQDPTGPTESEASPMPDGKKYKAMRGGNWYNGAQYYGHGRISNRNPSYFRGPLDPVHPYYHIGFRVVTRASLSGVGIASSKARGLTLLSRSSSSVLRLHGSLPAGSLARIEILDARGTVLQRSSLTSASLGQNLSIPLDAGLPRGLLLLRLESEGTRFQSPFTNL